MVDTPYRKMLAAKIHRATVTGADVNYEGSLTVPPELLVAAKIHPYESLHVWNVTRGTRLETYAIEGLPNSNDVCANGAAAHLIRPGDHVILAAYAMVPEADAATHKPRLIFVDDNNQLSHVGPEIAGPNLRSDSDDTHLVRSTEMTPDGQPLAEGC
ncbi:MAG: aspartate 1-decarboxylase [Rhodopirellula baltica]|uniref:Aspartate 1-decarboxylase n=1 Tax=Rhodopirellula baltica (strain DSM 10527 / NCIMB 13988 / SH1) TaxID=243090 RepID=PAND_RHOBA|nr:RecName: Full=Aspartate 1-decarboxylase; AltName: Full=Aspartate alpha-decarboxylase; Contains: RecName: Full=Aspartate 1-decarboxylase beta chain; Contains: RecName: Full=Aspartate 1-decarboxylase alpha chain; Flags: Precursor [Rhodopirellula baltica SH 1]CAD74603.1 aspartate 1-decarboxylase [Rhodopirellula baltica SH 1]